MESYDLVQLIGGDRHVLTEVDRKFVSDISAEQLQQFVRRLDPDEATDVLGLATDETQATVLQRLDEDRREKVEFLLEFSPESAAGLMHLDYVTVDKRRSFDDVARRVRRQEERTGRFPTVFVTDGDTLLGELPGPAMAEQNTDAITEYVQETPVVSYDSPDTDVVEGFRATPERSVAVLDDDGSILGFFIFLGLAKFVLGI